MSEDKPGESKLDALRARGALNARPEDVADPLFQASDFFDSRDLVQVKYEMLRRVRVDGQSVTAAAAAHGLSRPSFYGAKKAFEVEGLAGLVPKKRGPRGAHKLRDEVVDFVLEIMTTEGVRDSVELARRVQERFEVIVHPRSVERALERREKKLR